MNQSLFLKIKDSIYLKTFLLLTFIDLICLFLIINKCQNSVIYTLLIICSTIVFCIGEIKVFDGTNSVKNKKYLTLFLFYSLNPILTTLINLDVWFCVFRNATIFFVAVWVVYYIYSMD